MTPEQKENIRRKNFVRRCYKKSPLWAIELIRERYQDYSNSMLIQDLKIKRKSKKYPKLKREPEDFRTCQIKKYIDLMNCSEKNSSDYHKACIMISRLNEAHNNKKPIVLTLIINHEKFQVSYPWKSKEIFIKGVPELASKCSTFEEFDAKTEAFYKKIHSR